MTKRTLKIKATLKNMSLLLGVALLSGACSFPPHIFDWERERYTKFTAGNKNTRITSFGYAVPDVMVCFNRNDHSRAMIYDLARQECQQRISELQLLYDAQKLDQARTLAEAEGSAFSGPVDRQRRVNAILSSVQVTYKENDKWECPLLTPNRAVFSCVVEGGKIDSQRTTPIQPSDVIEPDLPPELPADLKPQ